MQVDSSDQIRNIALAGHADTGKTTLASAALYTSGVVNRLNKVEDGNATTDFDPEEAHRGYSIGLGTCFATWNKHKINILDTPGSSLFALEAKAGIRTADAVVLMVNAGAGVQVGTETTWALAEKAELPVLVHLNKLERENTDVERTVGELQEALSRKVVPIQLPIGAEHDFKGVVDLIGEKAYLFEFDGDGKATAVDIPAELADAAEEARNTLIEAVAESDDGLMEKYFEEGTLTTEELSTGLRKAILAREVFPLTLGSAAHGIGTSCFLDAVVGYLPDPTARGTFPATDLGGEDIDLATDPSGSVTALVFKTLNDPFSGKISLFRVVSGEIPGDTMLYNTTAEENEKVAHLTHLQGKTSSPASKLVCGDFGAVAKLKNTHTGDTLCHKDKPVRLGWISIRPPAISYAIEPKSKGDEEKINDALHRLMEEDLGLKSGRDPSTGEVLLSGSGQLHVEIALAKLKNRYKVEVILHPPKVPYLETIRKAADGHGRHKKQTGGRGQFADCKIKIEPIEEGLDFEFKDQIFGGSIPQSYRPAVEKGILETRERGYLAGYKVVDFRVRLLDGQYHDVDSSEMAFKIAGSMAFKEAMAKAGPTLLEPMMKVEVTCSDEFTGDVMGDLSQRRGRPQGMDTKGSNQIIKAVVPMSEMLDYAPALRSITQGRAHFTMEFSNYEEMPRNIQEKIIAEAKRAKEEHH